MTQDFSISDHDIEPSDELGEGSRVDDGDPPAGNFVGHDERGIDGDMMVATHVDIDIVQRAREIDVVVKPHMAHRNHDVGALATKDSGLARDDVFGLQYTDTHRIGFVINGV